MRRSIFSVLLVCIVFSFPPANYAQDLIRSVGTATIHNNSIDIARDKALDNAQRNAVEEKAGVMVTSVSEVENFQLKMDQILSESRGFISSYKVISEGRQGNTYKVTIEAEVETGRLKDRMEAVQFVMIRKSKPRLMFILNGKEKQHAIAESAMTKYFLSQGFTVVDVSSQKKIPGFSVLRNSSKDLSTVAHKYGAEIVILTHVEDTVKKFKMGEVEVASHEAAISGKIVNGDTGEVIATVDRTERGEFKAALEEASAKVARQMSEEILGRWSSELTNTAKVKLQISGILHDDLSTLKEKLREQVKGLKQIYQRSYSRGMVELDLEIRGDTQGLAEDLGTIRLRGKKIRIRETTPNTIEASVGSN